MTKKTPASRGKYSADYLNHPHPFRALKRRLSVAAAAAAALWVLSQAITGNRTIYSPGDVALFHSVIENNCTACHAGAESRSLFSRVVTDRACETCHAGPIHHSTQIFENRPGAQPACGSCHEDHKGRMFRPAFMADTKCTQCHSSLQQASVSASNFESSIESFDGSHPEFRIIRDQQPDTAAIKLNHKKHLRSGLPGAGGKPVQLQCSDCHRPRENGTTMMPIEFERDCQACHSLAFDERIREQAPHESPDIVDAFVRTAFSRYASDRPNEWKTDVDWQPPRRRAEFRRLLDEAPRDLPQWLELRVRDSNRLLLEKKCTECHRVEDKNAGIPAFAESKIPELWLTHSRFSHEGHRMLQCASCHQGAKNSESTADVLLPRRADCVQCHSPSAGAPSTCVTCHTYHDKTQSSPFPGSLTPDRIVEAQKGLE